MGRQRLPTLAYISIRIRAIRRPSAALPYSCPFQRGRLAVGALRCFRRHGWGSGQTALDARPLSRRTTGRKSRRSDRRRALEDRTADRRDTRFRHVQTVFRSRLHGRTVTRAAGASALCNFDYRDPAMGCSWQGVMFFDKHDNPVDDPALDVCSKRLSGCKCRFGEHAILPWGGFPSAGRNGIG